jgi:hypothetical protein
MILVLAHHYREICGLDMQLRRGRRVSFFPGAVELMIFRIDRHK